MQERLEVKNAAKERMKSLSFGDPVTNVCAGESNPHRIGYFVEYVVKTRRNTFGIAHSDNIAKCTDKKGNFWFADIEVIFKGHLDYDKCKELFAPIWSAHYE